MECRQFDNDGGHYDGGCHNRGGVTAQMDGDLYTDQ